MQAKNLVNIWFGLFHHLPQHHHRNGNKNATTNTVKPRESLALW